MSIELLGLTLGNETISLKEPSSMVITRAWDSPAWQLDITLPHEGPLDDLTKIQVKHGTDALFAGLCDEIVRSVDGNGAFVSISARTPGALLCDNEALPKTYTDLTAQAYFNAELKTLRCPIPPPARRPSSWGRGIRCGRPSVSCASGCMAGSRTSPPGTPWWWKR